eukprot:TRINITY_DN11550_c0_g1_i5.p1 TRINITY_DN11550_c0_g1~~TRINITY_DN11550_c0_g1_i5.p1  ORF type:complete len:183 (-),score=57.98 TRINITY_DN11550_c0_g1_i5:239-787(-)
MLRPALLLCLLAAVLVPSSCKKPRTAAEWNELSKKAEERMQEEEEEERRSKDPGPISFDPSQPMDPASVQRMMAGSKAGKPAMMFVTVLTDSRKETDELAASSRSILKDANGVQAQAYVIEDDKILYSLEDGAQGLKLKDVLLTLPQVVEFEWDQQKTPGPAKAEYDRKMAAKKAEDGKDEV